MIPRPARYLLRIDDLCPTVCRERWERVARLIEESRIRPILAVVPENWDPELRVSPEDAGFWNRMRTMETAGATIGLHGYLHLAGSRGRSLVPLHRNSEFAGVPLEQQREWIGEGLRILRGHGLDPKIWVAPRHGFDKNTLKALRAEGISILSDGFARIPFVRGGVTWIPQQLWAPVEKREGLWTICVHPNTVSHRQIEKLAVFLGSHSGQFTSVDAVLAGFSPARLNPAEWFREKLALGRMRFSRFKARHWRRRSASRG